MTTTALLPSPPVRIILASLFNTIVDTYQERQRSWKDLEQRIQALSRECIFFNNQDESGRERLYARLTQNVVPCFFSLRGEVNGASAFRKEVIAFFKAEVCTQPLLPRQDEGLREALYSEPSLQVSGIVEQLQAYALDVINRAPQEGSEQFLDEVIWSSKVLDVGRVVDELLDHADLFLQDRILSVWETAQSHFETSLTLAGLGIRWTDVRTWLPTWLGGVQSPIDALFEKYTEALPTSPSSPKSPSPPSLQSPTIPAVSPKWDERNKQTEEALVGVKKKIAHIFLSEKEHLEEARKNPDEVVVGDVEEKRA